MKKLILLISFLFLFNSCDSDDSSDSVELTIEQKLIGQWVMTDYYSDTFYENDQRGRLEKIVPEETDYGIEFLDNPKKILVSGFLRYSWKEYEIIEGDTIITSQGTNFMDGADNEGFHVTNWRIEDDLLISEDPINNGIEPFISKSEVQIEDDRLKLILDSNQFREDASGEIIVEYRRK